MKKIKYLLIISLLFIFAGFSQECISAGTTSNLVSLKTNYLKNFFTSSPYDDDFIYNKKGELYGFEQDFSEGCSVWCALEYTRKVTASSMLAEYSPENLLDGSRNTAWIEGADGYGIGEFVEFSERFHHVNGDDIDFLKLCIVNGYANDIRDWKDYSRVKKLKLYLNGEYIANIELKDTIKPQYINIKPLGIKVKSDKEYTLKFEIADIYKGEKYTNSALTGINLEVWAPNH